MVIVETIEVKGRAIEVGKDCFLMNVDDWNRDVAEFLAEKEGLQLTDIHWEVVDYLRVYYKQYQIAPMIKILAKDLGRKLGPDRGTTRFLYELFPAGPAKQACKIAGLPSPMGCV